MSDYHQLIKNTRAIFNTGKTQSVEWRRAQLQGIVRLLDENEELIHQAVEKDLGKPRFESALTEFLISRNEAVNFLNNFEKWMEPEKVPSTMQTMRDKCFIQREPFGVALILSPWNFPIHLVLLPLIGAVAAGNCAIIKPSEIAAESARILDLLIPKYLDSTCVHVVTGAVKETTLLLQEKFDYIFYTGSTFVGKIVMAAAAKHLTPVTLELGGKSPVFVDKSSDIDLVARRIMWGKALNSGQVCTAPDYLMCDHSLQSKLVEGLKKALKDFYNDDIKGSDSYARIINDRHFQRLKSLLAGSQIALGGQMDEKNRFMSPTVITNVKPTDKVMEDEIFGPILPIMPVSGVDEAIEYINSREKPLAMYIFTKDARVSDKFMKFTSSGGYLVNDTISHTGHEHFPFGGVGASGMGAYHGKYTFDTFSHKRPCMLKKQNMEVANTIRYPPYSEKKMNFISWAMKKQPKRQGLLAWLPIIILVLVLAVIFHHVF